MVEKNLANLVSEIRAAIGDDASDPQFIRTVARFGYAFREIVDRAGARRPMRGRAVVFGVTWISGRQTLDEGEYVLGRDPNVEIYLDAPKVSRLPRLQSDRRAVPGHEFGLRLTAEDKAALIAFLKTL